MKNSPKNRSFILLTEDMLRDAVLSVLMERKVIKVGGSQPAPSAPPMDMGQEQMPPEMPIDNGGDIMNSNMGGEMPPVEDTQQNQFDSNFDAGVEADEETDPKRYIQQLTGKLSQSLNSFNEENGPDAGLSKYVASMIIAAAAKNLDEKAKKELIEKINTASGEETEAEPEETGEELPPQQDDMQQDVQPLQESFITKKQLAELAFGTTKKREKIFPKSDNKKKNIFGGKSF